MKLRWPGKSIKTLTDVADGSSHRREPTAERTIGDDEARRFFGGAMELRDAGFWEADFQETAADFWSKVHYGLGLPIVVFSAVASTSALAEFDKSNVVAGVLALIVAVLSGLVTFLNPQKTAELHRNARPLWQALAFSAQSFARDLKPGMPEAETLAAFRALEDERSRLIRESPSASRRVREHVEKRVYAQAHLRQVRMRGSESERAPVGVEEELEAPVGRASRHVHAST